MTSPLELWDKILASVSLWQVAAGALREGSSVFWKMEASVPLVSPWDRAVARFRAGFPVQEEVWGCVRAWCFTITQSTISFLRARFFLSKAETKPAFITSDLI